MATIRFITKCMQQPLSTTTIDHDHKEVIPIFPEMITNADGSKKQDCKRIAAYRFFDGFRRERPHLKVIVIENALVITVPIFSNCNGSIRAIFLGCQPGIINSSLTQVDLADNQGGSYGI